MKGSMVSADIRNKTSNIEWCYEMLGRVINLAIADYQSGICRDRQAEHWLFSDVGENTLKCFLEHYQLPLNLEYLRRQAKAIKLYKRKEEKDVGMDRANIPVEDMANSKVDNRSGVSGSFCMASVEDEYDTRLSQRNRAEG